MSLICKHAEEVPRGLLWRAKGICGTKKKGGGAESLLSGRREKAEALCHRHLAGPQVASIHRWSLLFQNTHSGPFIRPSYVPHPGAVLWGMQGAQSHYTAPLMAWQAHQGPPPPALLSTRLWKLGDDAARVRRRGRERQNGTCARVCARVCACQTSSLSHCFRIYE